MTDTTVLVISQFSDLSSLPYVQNLYTETPHNEYTRDQRRHARFFYRILAPTDAGLDTICPAADTIYII